MAMDASSGQALCEKGGTGSVQLKGILQPRTLYLQDELDEQDYL